jgi:hypothetical protein
LGICGFRYVAMITGSCTSLFLYFSSFAFIPTVVSLPLISSSYCSLSSQCFRSKEMNIGTRSSVDL